MIFPHRHANHLNSADDNSIKIVLSVYHDR